MHPVSRISPPIAPIVFVTHLPSVRSQAQRMIALLHALRDCRFREPSIYFFFFFWWHSVFATFQPFQAFISHSPHFLQFRGSLGENSWPPTPRFHPNPFLHHPDSWTSQLSNFVDSMLTWPILDTPKNNNHLNSFFYLFFLWDPHRAQDVLTRWFPVFLGVLAVLSLRFRLE